MTLSRAMQGTDHAAALEENGLRQLVKYIRECAIAMGDEKKMYDPVVDAARKKLARSLTSKKAIPAETVLTEDMLILKSPGTGIMWRDCGLIVGKKAKHDIAMNQLLSKEDFE